MSKKRRLCASPPVEQCARCNRWSYRGESTWLCVVEMPGGSTGLLLCPECRPQFIQMVREFWAEQTGGLGAVKVS